MESDRKMCMNIVNKWIAVPVHWSDIGQPSGAFILLIRKVSPRRPRGGKGRGAA